MITFQRDLPALNALNWGTGLIAQPLSSSSNVLDKELRTGALADWAADWNVTAQAIDILTFPSFLSDGSCHFQGRDTWSGYQCTPKSTPYSTKFINVNRY